MSIFTRLFGSSKNADPADLSILHTDFHSHFIPGIDDGAKTMEDSLQLIEGMSKFGYKKVITTPHVMSDHFRNTPAIILSGLEKVREAVKVAGIPIEVEAAAEYYLDYDLERKMNEEQLLTFGKNYLLFELSFMNPPDNLHNFIFEAQLKGYKPILAHPERYPFWSDKFTEYQKLFDKGVHLQLNINSLSGYYSHQVKVLAEKLIKNGLISFLGSDCHHAGHINMMSKVVYERSLTELLASGKLLNNTL